MFNLFNQIANAFNCQTRQQDDDLLEVTRRMGNMRTTDTDNQETPDMDRCNYEDATKLPLLLELETTVPAVDIRNRPTIIYTRVSTKKQNLLNQYRLCKLYCERYGLTIQDSYTEKNSAFHGRPYYLEKILKGNNFNLVVAAVDRLVRNKDDIYTLIEDMQVRNIKLLVCTQNVPDTAKFIQLAESAAEESQKISDRVYRAQIASISRCTKNNLPHGYQIDASGNVCVDLTEKRIMKFIRDLYFAKKIDIQDASSLLRGLMAELGMLDQYMPISIFQGDTEMEFGYFTFKPKHIKDILDDYNIRLRGARITRKDIVKIIAKRRI